MPTEIPQPIPNPEAIPHPNRMASLMLSAKDSLASRFHSFDLRPSASAVTRAALGLSILTLGLAVPASARAQDINSGQGVMDVAGVSLEENTTQVGAGGEPPPDPNLLAQAEPIQSGVENLRPSQFTDILVGSGWTVFEGITRLSNGNLRIPTLLNGTERKTINRSDTLQVGDKGFEVQVKMNTVNENNPTGVSSKIVLINKPLTERNRLEVDVGFNNEGNLLVSFVDINNPVPSQRTVTLVGSRDRVYVPSDELRIQFTGTGSEERINVYAGSDGPLLAGGLQLPKPFFDGGGTLLFGTFPQSVWQGPVMTVGSFSAGSY